jgi:hypothetical protein
MESPKQIVEQIAVLLEEARACTATEEWQAAQAAVDQALLLDENHAPSYDAMADVCDAMGQADKAAQWRDKSNLVRKQAWQRQVEAEARGHHELLGEPGRHEIP